MRPREYGRVPDLTEIKASRSFHVDFQTVEDGGSSAEDGRVGDRRDRNPGNTRISSIMRPVSTISRKGRARVRRQMTF